MICKSDGGGGIILNPALKALLPNKKEAILCL
jgi:hypothetical protein